jgi:3'-5' exoribonuclease
VPAKSIEKQFIENLNAGERVTSVFAVAKCECRASKNGEQFLSLTLADRTGKIDAKRWRVPEDEAAFVVGLQYIQIDGQVEEYGGKLQISIKAPITDAGTPENLSDFEVCAALPLAELTLRFDAVIDSVRDTRLKALLENIFCDADFRAKFNVSPAAQNLHHACKHGLLQHTLEVSELADAIARLQQNWGYQGVSRDLVVTGALLHDIGKVYELKQDGASTEYTRSGTLIGHITIGFQMIIMKSRDIPGFSVNLRDALTHIILAHHGKGEFGSPVTPKMREAQIVSAADDLNVRLYYMTQVAQEAAEGQDFADHWAVEGRKIYVGPLDVQTEEAIQIVATGETEEPSSP